MSREDIQKLLGGYATGTLTPEEQQALFEAALSDQDLFDQLAREQALRDLLRDPACKAEILAALDDRPLPWYRRLGAWRPAAAALAMAGIVLVSVVVLRRNANTVKMPMVAAVKPAEVPRLDRMTAEAPAAATAPAAAPAKVLEPKAEKRAAAPAQRAAPVLQNGPVSQNGPVEKELDTRREIARDAKGGAQPASDAAPAAANELKKAEAAPASRPMFGVQSGGRGGSGGGGGGSLGVGGVVGGLLPGTPSPAAPATAAPRAPLPVPQRAKASVQVEGPAAVVQTVAAPSAKDLFYNIVPPVQSFQSVGGAAPTGQQQQGQQGVQVQQTRNLAYQPSLEALTAAIRAPHPGVRYSFLRKTEAGGFVPAESGDLKAGDQVQVQLYPNSNGRLVVKSGAKEILSVAVEGMRTYNTPVLDAGDTELQVTFTPQPGPAARGSLRQDLTDQIQSALTKQLEADQATYVVGDSAGQTLRFAIKVNYK